MSALFSWIGAGVTSVASLWSASCLAILVTAFVEPDSQRTSKLLAAGFLGLVAVPASFCGALILRVVAGPWLKAKFVGSDASASRLLGWITASCASLAVLFITMYVATLWLSKNSTFLPVPTALGVSFIAVSTVIALVLAAPAAAATISAGALALNMRWRARGHATLLRPSVLLAAFSILGTASAVAVWRGFLGPRVGVFDFDPLIGPAVGVPAGLALHALWRRIPGRNRVAMTLGLIWLGLSGFAVVSSRTNPDAMIDLWGSRPLTGAAIQIPFDIEAAAEREPAKFRPKALTPQHPDIVVITIDTVRADATPPYGGTAAMPTLASVAQRGVVFGRAMAPTNVTRRSLPAIMLGVSASRVRGRVTGWALRLDPRQVMLAERLQAAGYETAGFVCCAGFWGDEARTGLERGLGHIVINQDGYALAAAAHEWFSKRPPGQPRAPFFAWLHFIEPHNWPSTATSPPRTPAEYRRAYARMLTAVDEMLAEVMQGLQQRGPAGPLLVITADHGEGLGEHGAIRHATDLYNSQMHVPLLISGPTIRPARIDETVSLSDVAPTLLELAGFETPRDGSMDGRSVADLIQGRRPAGEGAAFASMVRDRHNPGGVHAYVRGHWKLIETGGRFELYEIARDPNETNNVIRDEPEIARELRDALLKAKMAAARSKF